MPYEPYNADSAQDAINDIVSQFRLPRQNGQTVYVEVWVEKDAISSVLKRVTSKYGVKILVNRGYGSASSMYDAYERIEAQLNGAAERAVIIYLGDHDPSGLDMIRDINDRIAEMLAYSVEDSADKFEVKQIALTMKQIRQYSPPPNPAKTTDTRSPEYIRQHGNKSWEVDALKPEVLNALLTKAIEAEIDISTYTDVMDQERDQRTEIRKIGTHYGKIKKFVAKLTVDDDDPEPDDED
jgi:hypothetical protein